MAETPVMAAALFRKFRRIMERLIREPPKNPFCSWIDDGGLPFAADGFMMVS
jgi:hypothetical protein